MTTSNVKSGDVLVCYGRGFVSGVISYLTPRLRVWRKAPSHVAVIAVHSDNIAYAHESTSMSKLADALTGKPRRGVQAHKLHDWLAFYQGRVDLHPLKARLLNEGEFIRYLLRVHARKVEYDTRAAFHSASPVINSDGSGPLFCSALAGYALRRGGAIDWSVNPAELTPWDICNLPCLDKPRRLK